MIHEHSRLKIYNIAQHPLQHDIGDLFYANLRLPGISNLSDTLDYIVSVLYPNYIATFATQAAMNAYVGPVSNDYAIVTDDGDGKSAGYVYTVIDGLSQWVKRYDVDWSLEGIFAETINRTQYMYMHKYGFTDHDSAGVATVGIYAGQTIYGGNLTGQNLTLNGNSVDATGFVQTDNHFRPTANNTLDVGTAALNFRTLYAGTSALISTLTLSSGSIVSSTGAITFDNENLSTTGTLASGDLTVTGSGSVTTTFTVNSAGNALILATGSITSATGAITFDNENLSTTGTLASGTLTVSADMVIATGSITSASGTITFVNENLNTTGTLGAGDTTVTQLNADNVRVDGNTISVTNANGNLIVQANGTGVVDVQSAMTTIGQTITGVLTVTGQANVDNLRLDGNVISSTNLNGNITFTPNGSGLSEFSSGIFPTTTATQDIGKTGNLWQKLWLSGSIGGATEITVADLMTLRSVPYRDFARTIPAVAGDALFWDAVNSVWLANHPDTEITHSELTGLTTTDAGHTQFALLAGRAGGQTLNGGTLASQDLTLDSTAHATKGSIFFSSPARPTTDATFAVTWSGTDLGGPSNYFRDLYTRGELRGFRFENFTFATLPAASASAIGRTVYTTDHAKLYTDIGGSWKAETYSKFQSDTSWNGTDLTKDVTVSASVVDARTCVWQLKDNANDYEEVYGKVMAISASTVRITTNVPLPAGSYRLVGLE